MNRHKFPVLPNPKFLIPKSFNIGELMLVVKDKMRLDQRVTMVFTTGKVVLKPMDSMEILYKKYKDVDGFLYIIYMEE